MTGYCYFWRMPLIPHTPSTVRTRKEGDRWTVFDLLRKQWVHLSPEEWVRQHFLQYLLEVMKYPAALIAVEKEIRLGELKKRFDILVYDAQHQPWMMVECKAETVPLDETVLQQVLRYNISAPVTYLIITNGPAFLGWKKNEAGLSLLEVLPPHGA